MRETAFQDLCYKQGLTYTPKDEFGTMGYLMSFDLFKHKSNTIKHLCQKKDSSMEEEISLFDFSYMIMVGKVPVSVNQTVFFVNSKSLGVPDFKMTPQNFSHKINKFFGMDDINFEENPYFSDKYYLKGEHESFIRHTFDPEVLHFFSGWTGLTVEACNYYMILYKDKSLVPDEELESFYQMGIDMYQQFIDQKSESE